MESSIRGFREVKRVEAFFFSEHFPIELPIFAHRLPIKTFKSATGYVTTCTTKMQKGERRIYLRPPN
jgi:hypothetical protein